jgi:hypothetical protein
MRDTHTPAQLEIFRLIGRAYKLRIPHDGSQPELVPFFSEDSPYSVPVKASDFQPLIDEGSLHKITEHGEPPIAEREGLMSYRLGWRELELDGEHADYYCMTV